MTVAASPPRLVEEQEGRWLLDEEDIPEIPLHDAVIRLLELVLQAFAEREARSALITSNLGCRWDPADARVGVDPDVLLVEPMPPEGEKTTTLRVWEPGHAPPRVAVEIVSEQSGRKDYVEGPARYARLGAHELWIFDPLLVGPSDTGGPFMLQVWRRNEQGAMAREHAGAGPARSEELGAWLVVTDGGTRLRLADDPLGERLWLTKAEAASRQAAAESRRAETESRRAEAEAERADERQRLLDAAEAEIARLRAELARRGSFLRAPQRASSDSGSLLKERTSRALPSSLISEPRRGYPQLCTTVSRWMPAAARAPMRTIPRWDRRDRRTAQGSVTVARWSSAWRTRHASWDGGASSKTMWCVWTSSAARAASPMVSSARV